MFTKKGKVVRRRLKRVAASINEDRKARFRVKNILF
jgi:hypothetical protein